VERPVPGPHQIVVQSLDPGSSFPGTLRPRNQSSGAVRRFHARHV
jgi:hypothetical protein